MPERPSVEFRTGVRNSLGYAARWLRDECAPDQRVRVLADASDLSALSHLLWVGEREGFVPHAMAGVDHARPGMARTRVWLGSGPVAGAEPTVLLNIGTAMPAQWRDCERVVEIVPADGPHRLAGRARYAAYRDLGVPLEHRDAADDEVAHGGRSRP